MLKENVKPLLVTSALFGILGVFMGGHLAGAGDYSLRAVHAHALVVGWLSLFSWGIYYQIFTSQGWLSKVHTWTAIIGTTGLVIGMWVYNTVGSTLTMISFIVGGTILMISYILFLFIVIKQK